MLYTSVQGIVPIPTIRCIKMYNIFRLVRIAFCEILPTPTLRLRPISVSVLFCPISEIYQSGQYVQIYVQKILPKSKEILNNLLNITPIGDKIITLSDTWHYLYILVYIESFSYIWLFWGSYKLFGVVFKRLWGTIGVLFIGFSPFAKSYPPPIFVVSPCLSMKKVIDNN